VPAVKSPRLLDMPIIKSTLTHGGDALALSEQLDFEEMMALSGLFRLWAVYEDKFAPEQRTRLIGMSADFEELAKWVGEGWRASDPPAEMTIFQFLARQALENRNVIDFQQAKREIEWAISPEAAILTKAGPEELKLLKGLWRRNPELLSSMVEYLAEQDRVGLRQTLRAFLFQDARAAEEIQIADEMRSRERKCQILIQAAWRLVLLLDESEDPAADRRMAVRILDENGLLERAPLKNCTLDEDFARELIERNPLLYAFSLDRLEKEPNFKAKSVEELISSLVPIS
jgi:hypothetical protein